MTALVILHHTAITYGAAGGWFYYELHPSGSTSSLLLTLFCATQQAYFMGFFFLLAGYFTPPSLERKGYAQFLGDRFMRLGIPLLAFIFILGPLTAAMVTVHEGKGFWPHFLVSLESHHHHQRSALVRTGAADVLPRLLRLARHHSAPLAQRASARQPVPSARWWLLSAISVGAISLAIRQFVPTGMNVIGLQLGYFATYIFLFAIGIAAWRYDWLRQLNGRTRARGSSR